MAKDAGRQVIGHRVATVALLPLQALLGVLSTYLAVLTAVAWRALRTGAGVTAIATEPKSRFCVLMAAHDEERVIGHALRSLASLDYPKTHYSVYVVADNCSDSTADIVRVHGWPVSVRHAPGEPGKGPALNWLYARVRTLPHDAVVVIDADTTVSPNFLRVMDSRLQRGDRVIQGYYTTQRPETSWVVALRHAALAARHYLRPLARTALDCSGGLYGNGMVFAADVMDGTSWSQHLTEDVKFEAELLLAGERATFAPDAVVEAAMPDSLAGAQTQNERWERGRLEVARQFVPQLLRASWSDRDHRLRYFDAALDSAMPPLSVVGGALGLAVVASGALAGVRPTLLTRSNLALSLASVGAMGAYVASGLRMVSAPAQVWRALLGAPIYVPWKLGVALRVAVSGKAMPWIRTARE